VALFNAKWNNMITQEHYFGHKIHHADATPDRIANATWLLEKVNALIGEAQRAGIAIPEDPDTGTQISGTRGGAGDGGFRLSTATTGRPGSAHKEGMGVDVYDPHNALDGWLINPTLAGHDLYREAADATPGWCHLQIRPPRSGARTYNP
jgi:hypothetical protein